MRVGLSLPVRPDDHRAVADPRAAIGCLRPWLREPLLERLRALPGITLHEARNFRRAVLQGGRVWLDDEDLCELDAFVWYGEVDRRPGSYDLEVLRTLARRVRVVRDPGRFEDALDKHRAHLALRDAGVRVPDFVLFDHRCPERMRAVLDEWGAAVLKPRRGGWGVGVMAVDDWATLRDLVDYVRSTRVSLEPGFFLERFVPNDLTRWVSVTVVGGRAAFGYRKRAAKHAPLGRIGTKILDADERGGEVDLAELTPEHVAMAEAASRALGLGMVGFDMIWTDEGPMVIDENTSPGNDESLYRAAGLDAPALWAAWIADALALSRA